jgi:hypothetical protein
MDALQRAEQSFDFQMMMMMMRRRRRKSEVEENFW